MQCRISSLIDTISVSAAHKCTRANNGEKLLIIDDMYQFYIGLNYRRIDLLAAYYA